MVRQRKPADRVDRRIQFYATHCGQNESGVPHEYNPAQALNRIAGLGYNDDGPSRYVRIENGADLQVVPTRYGPYPALEFGQSRRSGLPRREQRGQVDDLGLDDDEGLFETIHVVFFPDGIVGADFNHYGPRITRLGRYMVDKGHDEPQPLDFEPLIRGNVLSQLDDLVDVRTFNFAIVPAYLEQVRQVDESAADMFAAARRLSGGRAEKFQVVMTIERAEQRQAVVGLLPRIRALAQAPWIRDAAPRMQVKGRRDTTGKVDEIDLLKDALVTRATMVRLNERGRAVDPTSAFEEIVRAYKQLEPELKAAAAVRTEQKCEGAGNETS